MAAIMSIPTYREAENLQRQKLESRVEGEEGRRGDGGETRVGEAGVRAQRQIKGMKWRVRIKE
jgi:hypothetical protein